MAELLGLHGGTCCRCAIPFSAPNVRDLQSMGWPASKIGHGACAVLDGVMSIKLLRLSTW